MAIQGKINFKGLQLDAYVKVNVGSISEKRDVTNDEETGEKIFSEKKFILNYDYELKATKESEIFYRWSDSCNVENLEINLYAFAYADLATKLEITKKEI